MTDISSKGSLPQLTDVLYLLTDSQELLLAKVQSLRSEYVLSTRTSTGEDAPVARRTLPLQRVGSSENDDPARRLESTSTSPAPMSGVAAPVPVVTAPPLLDAAASPERAGAGESPAPAPAAEHADALPVTASEQPDRGYNFFDDLDERLADLRPPDPTS